MKLIVNQSGPGAADRFKKGGQSAPLFSQKRGAAGQVRVSDPNGAGLMNDPESAPQEKPAPKGWSPASQALVGAAVLSAVAATWLGWTTYRK